MRLSLPVCSIFVHIFPGFIIADIEEWKFAVKNDGFIRAHSVGCPHTMLLKDNNIWVVDNDSALKSSTYLVDPIPIIDKYLEFPETLSVIPGNLPPKIESSAENIKIFISDDTVRGKIRTNDKNIPFSNGLSGRFVPANFSTIYYSKI